MKKSVKILILLSILVYIPFQSMAWGMLGHRIVGQIAESYLKNKTRKEVHKILGNESLAMASNWADFIKSDPKYNYLSNWHYINLPAGLSIAQLDFALQNDTITDAYTRINFLKQELKNSNIELNKKRMYLRLLIHLVGDIHQPMHTGHFEDLGGNNIKLSWFGQSSNLHRVWDSDLIESQDLSYTEYTKAINFIDPHELKSWQLEGPAQWVQDSYLISTKIYSGVKNDDKLSYRYIYDHIEIAEKQLLKGGIHLASILNDIYTN